jgi:hypothetical protein
MTQAAEVLKRERRIRADDDEGGADFPHLSSGTPITAHSATAGWPAAIASTWAG